MTNTEVLNVLESAPVVPLFYNSDSEVACKLIDACYQGGARAIEFTNRGEKAAEVFAVMVEYCRERYPAMALGVGSIANVQQAELFINSGADFFGFPRSLINHLRISPIAMIYFGLVVVERLLRCRPHILGEFLC